MEVNGAILGDEFADYTFRITGGIDKQGFPMKQGILTPDRVRLLLKEGKLLHFLFFFFLFIFSFTKLCFLKDLVVLI